MTWQRITLTLLFALAIHSYWAQPLNGFVTLSFDEDNGLTASDVYGVAQDNDGYIWIGTNKGLYKFDGTSFERYGPEEGIFSQLITRVYAFSDGDLIAVGENPMLGYLIRENQVHPFGERQEMFISGLLTAADRDTLWSNCAGCGSVLAIVDSQVVDSIALPTHEYKGRLVERLVKHNGVLYGIPYSPGFSVRSHGAFKRHPIPTHPDELLFLLSEDHEGDQWALGVKHLFKRDDHGGWEVHTAHQLAQGGQRIIHHAWDWAGRFWVAGVHRGLYLYDPQTREMNRVDDVLGIGSLQITHLFSDREQNIWISTAGHGLLYIRKSAFENYGLESGLASEYILKVRQRQDGQLLVATNAGVSRSIPGEANRRFISNTEENFYALDMNVAGGVDLFCTTSDKEEIGLGSVYKVNDAGHALLFWGRRLGHYTDDSLWVGNWFNVTLYVRDADGHWNHKPQKKYNIGGWCQGWAHWRGDWYSLTRNELLRYREDGFHPVDIALKVDGRLDFTSVQPHKDGLWITTSHGLLRWTPDDIDWFTTEDGLVADRCLSVTKDSSGTVWVGTSNGLCALFGGRTRIFQRGTGLPSNQIQSLCYDSSRHELWIGTSAGLSRLSLTDMPIMEEVSLPLYVKALEVIGDTLIRSQHVSLEETQNHLRLHFAAVKYISPEEVRYQYRLSGLQAEWTETEQNIAEYLALAPGEYEFQVRSRIAGSDWGPTAGMSFHIRPPLWRRWYFLLGVLVGLTALTIWFSRWNVQRVRKQELQKRKTLSTINRLEQRALQANMNPHFVFNTLNSIQHMLAKHKDPVAMDFVADFATLVRQNMEAASKRSITLKLEMERLERYLGLEAQRLEGRLKFEVTASDPLIGMSEEVQIPSLLIQPFVENAVWHGIAPKKGTGTVKVRFEQVEHDMLKVTVEDDGVGLSAKSENGRQQHVSRGVELTRQRLKMASDRNVLQLEELLNDDRTAKGTLVTLILDLD